MAKKDPFGSDPGVLGDLSHLGHDVVGAPAGLAYSLNDVMDEGEKELLGSGKKADPKKKEAKQPKLPTPEKATKDQTQSPYEQLANELAKQYLTQINQLQPLVSGQSATGLEGEAGQGSQTQLAQLLAGAGVSPALAKATEAPIAGTDPLQSNVNAAMQAQASAETPAAEGYAGAVKDTGEANTQTLTAAPWEQILQELASETAYRAASGTGAAAFGGTTANTPAFLQQYFKALGLGSVPAAGTSSTLPGVPGAVTKAAKGGNSSSVPSDGNSTTP
jgi:hypothetical protein